jgi:transposase
LPLETRTAASIVPEAKPTREPQPYEQTAHGFERFQKRLQESGVAALETLVVMEATGSYWIALATALYHAGFAVSVINPAQAHAFAKAQLKRAKNDALDAQTIAELAQALVPACWTPPPRIYYELKPRLAQRASLLQWRTQLNNQLHALWVSPHGLLARRRDPEFFHLRDSPSCYTLCGPSSDHAQQWHQCARPGADWPWGSCACQDALVFSHPGRSTI